MTKKEKEINRLVLKRFFKYAKDEKFYVSWRKNLKKSFGYDNSNIRILDNIRPNIISSSFVWDMTREGRKYWLLINLRVSDLITHLMGKHNV